MANKVLRPSGPQLGKYNNTWQVQPSSFYWQAIDEIVEDGDTTYLYTDEPNEPFTVRCTDYLPGGFPKQQRVDGILVVATVRLRDPGPPVNYRFRVIASGTNFDTENISFSSNTYKEVWRYYPQVPNGNSWDAATLNDLEIGLIFVDGENELRCTKMEVHVVSSAVPDIRLQPNNLGTLNEWTVVPNTIPSYFAVSGPWDGDITVISSSANGDTELYGHEQKVSIGVPLIEKVQVRGACRTKLTEPGTPPELRTLLRIGGNNYVSGTHDLGSELLPAVDKQEYAWTLLTGEFYYDPSVTWPDGSGLAAPWTLSQVNACEIGLENLNNEELRCSELVLDMWTRENPTSSLDMFPIGDNAQFHDIPGITPVKAYPNIYENVDEDPPDDAGSYIGEDATTIGYPVYGTFSVGPAPVIPAGEQIYSVEVHGRIRLGGTASALVALCSSNNGNELIIGKPIRLAGTGTTWFDIKETLWENPSSGGKWQGGHPESLQYGIAILEGEAFCSQIKVVTTTCPLLTAASDPCDFQLTDEADTIIFDSSDPSSLRLGTVYEVFEFGVGTGGFNPAIPTTVLPVNTADIALVNEVLRRPIDKVNFINGSPSTVTYWGRVPRELLLGYMVGEVGLYCRILWSLDPLLPTGYTFLWAILHMPGQVMHDLDTPLYRLLVNYP